MSRRFTASTLTRTDPYAIDSTMANEHSGRGGVRRVLRVGLVPLAVVVLLVPALTFAQVERAARGTPVKSPTPVASPQLRLAMPNNSPTVDPALVADEENVQLANLLYTGLVRLDARYRVRPAAAAKIDISRDHRHYTFHLRRNLKFSDGDPITAPDFQFSLTRSLDPRMKSPSAPFYLLDIAGASAFLAGKAKTVSGITVSDPYTLKITTRWPVTYFLMELTYPAGFVLDSKRISKAGSAVNTSWYPKPVSSGPFRLKSFVPNSKIVLVRNKFYAGAKPNVSQITISLSALPSTDLYNYVSRNLDIVSLPSYDATLLGQPGVRNTNALAIDGLYMDLKSKPFNDRRVRQAFAMSLRRDSLTSTAMGPTVTPFFGFVPPGEAGYFRGLKGPPFAPKTARALLRQAGYSSARPFPSVTLSYVSDPALDLLVARIVEAWRKNLGITVTTRALTAPKLFSGMQAGTMPLYLYGWSADYPDPHDWLSLLWRSDAVNNAVHFHNKTFDRLVAAADVTWKWNRRMSLYNQSQQVLARNVAWLPLYIPRRLAYVRQGVTNVTVTGYGIIPQAGSWSTVGIQNTLPGSRFRR